MDPITLAITTALGGLGVKVINDAYVAFKAALQQKFGVDNDLLEAVDNLEKRPDSAGRQETLKEEIVRIGADRDQELVASAHKLIKLIDAEHNAPSGKNVVNISGGTVQGFIAENKGDVTMNFDNTPPQKE